MSMPKGTPPIARVIAAALHGRWPDDRYLHVPEAPLNSYRQGNKIDVLVIDQWQSGHHQTEAVEIKVSYSDWTREWRKVTWVIIDHNDEPHDVYRQPDDLILNQFRPHPEGRVRYRHTSPPPEGFEPTVNRIETVCTNKNLDWRRHAHRFWIAAPPPLAAKIAADCERMEELADWGVLAVTEQTRILRKPKTTMPEPWPPGMWLGIVRAAADAGTAALARAEDKGWRRGKDHANHLHAAELSRYADNFPAATIAEYVAMCEGVTA